MFEKEADTGVCCHLVNKRSRRLCCIRIFAAGNRSVISTCLQIQDTKEAIWMHFFCPKREKNITSQSDTIIS